MEHAAAAHPPDSHHTWLSEHGDHEQHHHHTGADPGHHHQQQQQHHHHHHHDHDHHAALSNGHLAALMGCPSTNGDTPQQQLQQQPSAALQGAGEATGAAGTSQQQQLHAGQEPGLMSVGGRYGAAEVPAGGGSAAASAPAGAHGPAHHAGHTLAHTSQAQAPLHALQLVQLPSVQGLQPADLAVLLHQQQQQLYALQHVQHVQHQHQGVEQLGGSASIDLSSHNHHHQQHALLQLQQHQPQHQQQGQQQQQQQQDDGGRASKRQRTDGADAQLQAAADAAYAAGLPGHPMFLLQQGHSGLQGRVGGATHVADAAAADGGSPGGLFGGAVDSVDQHQHQQHQHQQHQHQQHQHQVHPSMLAQHAQQQQQQQHLSLAAGAGGGGEQQGGVAAPPPVDLQALQQLAQIQQLQQLQLMQLHLAAQQGLMGGAGAGAAARGGMGLPLGAGLEDGAQGAHMMRRHNHLPERLVTRDMLRQVFHLPIEEAARHMGIGQTMLKHYCRKFGIPRWPFRKRQSVVQLIQSIEEFVQEGERPASVEPALAKLRGFLDAIDDDPDIDLDGPIKKLRQAFFKEAYKSRVRTQQDGTEDRSRRGQQRGEGWLDSLCQAIVASEPASGGAAMGQHSEHDGIADDDGYHDHHAAAAAAAAGVNGLAAVAAMHEHAAAAAVGLDANALASMASAHLAHPGLDGSHHPAGQHTHADHMAVLQAAAGPVRHC